MKDFYKKIKTILKNIINFTLIYFYLKLMDWLKWILPSSLIKINNFIVIVIYIMIIYKIATLLNIKINIQIIKEIKEKAE